MQDDKIKNIDNILVKYFTKISEKSYGPNQNKPQ